MQRSCLPSSDLVDGIRRVNRIISLARDRAIRSAKESEKGGWSMSQTKTAIGMLKRRGLVRLKEFAGAGVSDVAVRRLVGSGTAERVERGVYGLSDRDPSDLETLARVSLKMPRSVVCLLSAARLHEIDRKSTRLNSSH